MGRGQPFLTCDKTMMIRIISVLCSVFMAGLFLLLSTGTTYAEQLIIVPPSIKWAEGGPSRNIMTHINDSYKEAVRMFKKELDENYRLPWQVIVWSKPELFYRQYDESGETFLCKLFDEMKEVNPVTFLYCRIIFDHKENTIQINVYGYLKEEEFLKNFILSTYMPRIKYDRFENGKISILFLNLFIDVLNQGYFLGSPQF